MIERGGEEKESRVERDRVRKIDREGEGEGWEW